MKRFANEIDNLKQQVTNIEDFAASAYEFQNETFMLYIEGMHPFDEELILNDPEKYQQTLEDIESLTYNEYCDDIDLDSLKEQYINNFSRISNSDADDFDWDVLTDELLDISVNNKNLENAFNDIVNTVYEEWEAESNGLGDNVNKIDNKNVKDLLSAYDMFDVDDKVNDVYALDARLDYNSRDNAFIYLDGEIIEGTTGESHSQILQDYLNENDIDVPDDMKYNDPYYKSRPGVNRVKRLTNSDDVAFGHIINDCAFIETLSGNVTPEEVSKACTDYEKTYQYDPDNVLVKRIAKNTRI